MALFRPLCAKLAVRVPHTLRCEVLNLLGWCAGSRSDAELPDGDGLIRSESLSLRDAVSSDDEREQRERKGGGGGESDNESNTDGSDIDSMSGVFPRGSGPTSQSMNSPTADEGQPLLQRHHRSHKHKHGHRHRGGGKKHSKRNKHAKEHRDSRTAEELAADVNAANAAATGAGAGAGGAGSPGATAAGAGESAGASPSLTSPHSHAGAGASATSPQQQNSPAPSPSPSASPAAGAAAGADGFVIGNEKFFPHRVLPKSLDFGNLRPPVPLLSDINFEMFPVRTRPARSRAFTVRVLFVSRMTGGDVLPAAVGAAVLRCVPLGRRAVVVHRLPPVAAGQGDRDDLLVAH